GDRRRSPDPARARVPRLRRRGAGQPHERAGVRGRAAPVPVRRLRCAQAGRRSTGSAGRAVGGGPHVSVSNLILRPGTAPARDLEKLERGLLVTDLMGFGFNSVTGDYSQGAGGFWIERGERAFPVSEITISSNFDDLWKGVDAIGDDLDTRTA